MLKSFQTCDQFAQSVTDEEKGERAPIVSMNNIFMAAELPRMLQTIDPGNHWARLK